jgi:hypothetical protein
VRAPALQRDVTRLCECASKIAANVGMGDANQGLGALAQAEPEQDSHAVFGDDPVNMSTRGHHTSAGFSDGTIRLTVPRDAVEGRAMIGLPPSDNAAPRMKSICPPMPL